MTDDRKDDYLHMRLSPEDAAEIDRVARWMRSQRSIARIAGTKGRPNAVRYAIGQLVAMLPDEDEAEG